MCMNSYKRHIVMDSSKGLPISLAFTLKQQEVSTQMVFLIKPTTLYAITQRDTGKPIG